MASRHTINARPRRNIENYKPLITQWMEEGVGNFEIMHRLQRDHGAIIGLHLIRRRQIEWGLAEPPPKGMPRVRNLDPYKDKVLRWSDEGVPVRQMTIKFRDELGKVVPATTLHRALKAWSEPLVVPTWRLIDARPPGVILPFPPAPMDLLGEKELAEFERHLISGYEGISGPTGWLSAPRLDQDENPWTKILVTAACYDGEIQGLLIKERLQPGLHWDPRRLFDPLWVLGVQLPSSYEDERINARAAIMQVVDTLTPRVLEIVYSRLSDLLERSISVSVREEGEDYVRAAQEMTPATTPAQCMISLLRMIRNESTETQTDIRLEKSLTDLSRSTGLQTPTCRDLHHDLAEENTSTSLLDRFTAQALEHLRRWEPPRVALGALPSLTASDMKLIERAELGASGGTPRAEDEGDPDGDQEHDADGESDDDQETNRRDDDGAGGGRKPTSVNLSQEASYARLYKLLSDRVKHEVVRPLVHNDWRAPTRGALLGTAPARFTAPAWEASASGVLESIITQEPPTKDLGELLGSFSDCRKLSVERISPTQPGDKEGVFRAAVDHLKLVVSSQTPKEASEYANICKRMCECTTRPAGAEDLPALGTWNPLVRNDDWWHCRRLLQMIATMYSIPGRQYRDYELQLMMLLAAVEGGSTEPLPWLMSLDGLLKAISRRVHSVQVETRAQSTLQDNMLLELITFAHSAALNNVVLRFHSTYERHKARNAPYNYQRWYKMVYSFEPYCAIPGCLRLLPSPRVVTSNASDRIFSVGYKGFRIGIPAIRAFISHNRKASCTCLVSWMRGRDPHPALIGAFLWYSGLFHRDTACKAGRGKWLANF